MITFVDAIAQVCERDEFCDKCLCWPVYCAFHLLKLLNRLFSEVGFVPRWHVLKPRPRIRPKTERWTSFHPLPASAGTEDHLVAANGSY